MSSAEIPIEFHCSKYPVDFYGGGIVTDHEVLEHPWNCGTRQDACSPTVGSTKRYKHI